MDWLSVADRLDRLASRIAVIVGWLLLVLVAVVCFDVVTRRFFVFYSTFFQELEWHLHTLVFTMALGYAYLRGAHVRIDIIRDRMTPRGRSYLELAGILLFLLPFCTLIGWFGLTHAHQSFVQGEASTSAQGIPFRFLIKSTIPIGMGLMIIAAIAVAIRHVLFLAGRAPPAETFHAEIPGAGHTVRSDA